MTAQLIDYVLVQGPSYGLKIKASLRWGAAQSCMSYRVQRQRMEDILGSGAASCRRE